LYKKSGCKLIYKKPSANEISQIVKTINRILGTETMNHILETKSLIKIKHQREEVYLVSQSDMAIFKKISSIEAESKIKLVHARVKLGFFIQNSFMVSIEAISFLAPLTQQKILLNERDTKRFIYGKDIKNLTLNIRNQIEKYNTNFPIMIFSSENIPLGFAKIHINKRKPWLQNLIDIGIYLRSEKSAF
jgi:ribosome biogenesis protein Nip4